MFCLPSSASSLFTFCLTSSSSSSSVRSVEHLLSTSLLLLYTVWDPSSLGDIPQLMVRMKQKKIEEGLGMVQTSRLKTGDGT